MQVLSEAKKVSDDIITKVSCAATNSSNQMVHMGLAVSSHGERAENAACQWELALFVRMPVQFVPPHRMKLDDLFFTVGHGVLAYTVASEAAGPCIHRQWVTHLTPPHTLPSLPPPAARRGGGDTGQD